MFLFAALLATATAANAQKTDTVRFEQPKEVVVVSTDSSLTVDIIAYDNYKFNRSLTLDKTRSMTTERSGSEWNFNFPLSMAKSHNKKTSGRYESDLTMGAFHVGWNTALGGPSGLDTNMGSSWEIGFSPLTFNYTKDSCPWAYSFEFWLNWKNFRMTDNVRFALQNNHIQLADYPAGADIEFSRLKFFSMQFPLMVHYSLSKHWRLSAGPVVNVTTHASLKTRYATADGERVKDTSNHINHQTLTVDLLGTLTYHGCGLYVKYSPCHQLRNGGNTPQFGGISTGLILFY